MMKNMKEHQKIMVELKELNQNLITKNLSESNFMYLDIPIHNNFGDLLIMLGTLRLFLEVGIAPKEIFSAYSFNKKTLNEDTKIVFHGGGNFGDLYPLHQQHREDIVSHFSKNHIIILPQTLFFTSENKMRDSIKVFRKHKKITFYVRDKKSYDLALLFTDDVILCPDMAHSLYHPESNFPIPSNTSVLNLLRKDKESKTNIHKNSVDWEELTKEYRTAIRMHTWIHKKSKHIPFFSSITNKSWISLTKKIYLDMKKEFSKHSLITTDRLHGHIFSCLVDRPSKIHDNYYGKNSSYIKQWTSDSPYTKITTS